MRSLLLIPFTIVIVIAVENYTIRKCCNKNENIKIVNNIDISVNYECVGNVTEKYPLIFGEKYNVVYGFPKGCDVLELNYTESRLLPSDMNQCIDRATIEMFKETESNIDRIIILSCGSTNSNPPGEIGYVNKCCAKNQSYDVTNQVCRFNSEGYVVPDTDFLKNAIKTEDYVYKIDYNHNVDIVKFAVTLSDKYFKISLEGSNLNIVRKDNGVTNSVNNGSWCIDHEFESGSLVARIYTNECEDFGAVCLRKCCRPDEHYVPRRANTTVSSCVMNTEEQQLLNLSYYLHPLKKNGHYPETIGLRSELRCPNGKILLQKSDTHYLNEDGLLINSVSAKGYTSEFCFETIDNSTWGGEITFGTVVCFESPNEVADKFTIAYVTIPISCVFLGLTLLVYLLLPELRNLHGRTLICHVCVMLIGFACLARVQHGYVEDSRACTFYGYAIYFAFVSAFLWLNVMCFDIWWTFGSMRTMQPFHKKHAERRRFIWYSLYAWSLSFILTLTMFLMDLFPISDVLDANIGNGICWFGSIQNSKTDWPHYIFFVIPMGIVTLVNLVLWVLTSRHCARVKSEVHRMQAGSAGDSVKKRFRADRAKYLLTVRLWVVMGASWVWEIISTILTQPQWLWTTVDVINELQGVFIFIILVLKPKVFFLVRKKLGIIKVDAHKNGATSTRTSSTFLSRTISHDERTNLRTSIPVDKVK